MVRGENPRQGLVLVPHETRFGAPPGHVRMYRVGHRYIWKVTESAVPIELQKSVQVLQKSNRLGVAEASPSVSWSLPTHHGDWRFAIGHQHMRPGARRPTSRRCSQ